MGEIEEARALHIPCLRALSAQQQVPISLPLSEPFVTVSWSARVGTWIPPPKGQLTTSKA